ncbi:MAG: nucleotidyltransferase domain-containing protein [Bacteroidetes bacterium]|nr:MAG: nucleotidyltransferase domain-containing protein [Bacteroidota bacterium]
MAKIPAQIIEIIKKFIERALEDNIHISQAVLFGSYARGTNNEWSDIDVAVVSDDFEGIRIFDNKKIRKAKLKTSIDLETHPYRPEDFTSDNPFVQEILEYGIRIV